MYRISHDIARTSSLLLTCGALTACSTVSFAPPAVNPQLKANVTGTAGCVQGVAGAEIPHTVQGAMTLTDNYIFAYRCAERALADGRQYFQVPSFFAAVAGLIGPTLGMSNDAVLLTGTGAGVFNTGNSYYAPKAKAGLVSSALRALTCIKIEAVGISYFKTGKPKDPPQLGQQQQIQQTLGMLRQQESLLTPQVTNDAAAAARLAVNVAQQHELVTALADAVLEQHRASANEAVTIDAEAQYFDMVAGALLGVESILAERLRDTGSLDTADVFTKLKELAKAHADAEKALQDAKPKDSATGVVPAGSTQRKRDVVKLENAALQPKLQTCVLQAWA